MKLISDMAKTTTGQPKRIIARIDADVNVEDLRRALDAAGLMMRIKTDFTKETPYIGYVISPKGRVIEQC